MVRNSKLEIVQFSRFVQSASKRTKTHVATERFFFHSKNVAEMIVLQNVKDFILDWTSLLQFTKISLIKNVVV